jgi:hypothetical protein
MVGKILVNQALELVRKSGRASLPAKDPREWCTNACPRENEDDQNEWITSSNKGVKWATDRLADKREVEI